LVVKRSVYHPRLGILDSIDGRLCRCVYSLGSRKKGTMLFQTPSRHLR
jgi:hypothetical protein